MSVASFVPKLWAAGLEVPYQKSLVYADPAIAATKFQPMLANSGNSVEITTIGTGVTRTHDRTVPLTYDDVATTSATLTMDQEEYYGFKVNDVDKAQTAGEFQSQATAQHGIAMANKVDTYLAGLLQAGAGKKIGNVGVFDGAEYYRPQGAQATAWDAIRMIVKELDKVSAPSVDRWAVVGANFASALLADRRVTEADKAGTDTVARSGQIATLSQLGISIKVSNNVPTVAGREVITAGVPGALQFASQLRTMEALRDQTGFNDLIRGLQVFGGVVARKEGVVSLEADVTAGLAIYSDPEAP